MKDSLESMISELSASPEITGEVEEKKFPPPLSLEKEEETLSQEEEEVSLHLFSLRLFTDYINLFSFSKIECLISCNIQKCSAKIF